MANAQGVADQRLRSFIERIERLEEEKRAIAEDIKEVYSEAKSAGFETKIMRMIVKLRKMDSQERSEQEQLLEVYASAVGLAYTPLGEAAEKRDEADKGASVAKAVAAFVDGIPEGGSVTVTSGGKSTTITKDASGRVSAGTLPSNDVTPYDPETGEILPTKNPPDPAPDSAAFGATVARTVSRTISDAVAAIKSGNLGGAQTVPA